MGTWGYKHFENDSAFDYSSLIENSDNPKEVLRDTFGHTLQMENLSADQGQAIIAFATYVDSQVNGTKHSDNDAELLDMDASNVMILNEITLTAKACFIVSRPKGKSRKH